MSPGDRSDDSAEFEQSVSHIPQLDPSHSTSPFIFTHPFRIVSPFTRNISSTVRFLPSPVASYSRSAFSLPPIGRSDPHRTILDDLLSDACPFRSAKQWLSRGNVNVPVLAVRTLDEDDPLLIAPS